MVAGMLLQPAAGSVTSIGPGAAVVGADGLGCLSRVVELEWAVSPAQPPWHGCISLYIGLLMWPVSAN